MMQQKKYIVSLDQSTTTTKCSLFLFDGTLVDQQIIPHQQVSKNQGWLQHNPEQIYSNLQQSISIVIKRMKKKDDFKIEHILGVGLCNQRQTIVCWDSNTSKPLCNAIVWCDSRTKDVCQNYKQKYGSFSKITGLPVSTYFSLFKIIWLIENVQGLPEKVKQGTVRFGTIDTWIAFLLTGKYVTDSSNASRTHLLNISTGLWEKQLLQTGKINQKCLPKIVNSFEEIGEIIRGELKGIPICCIMGDQQSSAFAHNLNSSEMKITYGTGCFMLNNIGEKPMFSDSFVTTILNQHQGQRQYGFQVSVESGGGTINWAKKVGIIQHYHQLNNLQEMKQQLYFMPCFGSVYSPFWKSNVTGGIIGLNFNTKKQHIQKTILQSITYRLFDNIKNQTFNSVTKIIVDGGMTANKQFMQMQADLFGKQIQVRALDTCWGVAKGVLKTHKIPIKQKHSVIASYKPNEQKHEYYLQKYKKWSEARNKFYGW